MIIVDMFFITNCTTVWNNTSKSPWFNSSHFDGKQKQQFQEINVYKAFKTIQNSWWAGKI